MWEPLLGAADANNDIPDLRPDRRSQQRAFNIDPASGQITGWG